MSTTPAPPDGKKDHQGDDDRTVVVSASDDRTVVLPQSAEKGRGRPTTDNVAALPAGIRLFEFEITGLIGEGGFGIVYAAHDHSLDRDVAVKEYMPSSIASRTEGYTVSIRSDRYAEPFQAGLKSFVNEAKLLARFDHPSLVKVYRFWEINDTAYMAMPIYKGVTLKQRLKQLDGPPSEKWLRALLDPLLEALEVIHAENCFHRDIAPDNILLVEDERPVLLDFGAARRVIGDMTQDLTVILKPGYAPVEQYGEVSTMSQGPWTDIYALGAVLYYAIAGRTPDPSIGRLVEDRMKSLTELGQGRYTEAFLAAIDAALKVRPEERPQNVAAFRALLGKSDSKIDSANTAPMTTPGRTAEIVQNKGEPQHRQSRWGLNAAFAIVVIALVGGGVYFLRHLEATFNPSSETAVAPTQANTTVPPKSPVSAAPELGVKQAAELPRAVDKPETQTQEPAIKEPSPETQAPEVPSMPATSSPEPTIPDHSPESMPTPSPPSSVKPKPKPRDMRASMPAEKPLSESRSNDNEIQVLMKKAQENLSRNEYNLAKQYADRVLARDPANARAMQIKQEAQRGEKAAFDSIKIE